MGKKTKVLLMDCKKKGGTVNRKAFGNLNCYSRRLFTTCFRSHRQRYNNKKKS